MTQTFSAHFDGKVIVPDEPVQLPVGQPLRLVITVESPTRRPTRRLGTLKGTVQQISADFDAPLDDFKEYME
jgi:hypothetical protein